MAILFSQIVLQEHTLNCCWVLTQQMGQKEIPASHKGQCNTLEPKNPVERWKTIEISNIKPHFSYPHVTTNYSSDQQ